MSGKPALTEEEWTKEFGPKEPVVQEIVIDEAPKPAAEKPDDTQPEDKPEEEAEAEAEAEEPEPTRAPPGDDEVDVCIIFDYKGERWSHMFRVAKGCPVLDVKKAMVKSDSPEEDAISFDLQKRRVRLNNYDTVDNTDTFEFVYIGPEEGLKKRDRDKELKAQRDEQSRQFRLRNELAQKNKVEEPQPPPRAPVAAVGDLAITVTIDEDLDLKSVFKVSRGSTVLHIKQLISAADPTGNMKPSTFGLCLPGSSVALAGTTVLTEKHMQLEATDPIDDADAGGSDQPASDDPEEDPPDDESGPNVVVYVHELDAPPLKGKTMPLTVPKTVSVRYLRREICNKIGRKDISAVALHKKGTVEFSSSAATKWPRMEDDELLGDRREFFARGPKLVAADVPLQRVRPKAAPAPETAPAATAKGLPPPKKIPGGLDFLVQHDTADESLQVCMPKGKTVMDLKRAICDRVLRGPYTRVVLADSQGNVLTDTSPLDKMSPQEREAIRLAGIDIGLPFVVTLRVVHAENERKVETLSLDDTSSVSDVKKALQAKYKNFKLADVKVAFSAKKAGAPFTPVADGMRLNGKRELYAIGPLMDSLRPS